VKPLQILNESLSLRAVRRLTSLLFGFGNCRKPTSIGNNWRRCTLSIHRETPFEGPRRHGSRTARRQRRDQQRAEHGNVAVRSKAVNGRTPTHSLFVLLASVCASRHASLPLSFRFNFSPATRLAARASRQHEHLLRKKSLIRPNLGTLRRQKPSQNNNTTVRTDRAAWPND